MPRLFRSSRDLVDALFASEPNQRERIRQTRRLLKAIEQYVQTGSEPGINPSGLRLVAHGRHRLTVSVPSATQATGLRYRSRRLLDFVNKAVNGSFAQLVVKVAPESQSIPKRGPRVRHVTGAVVENLESSASSVSDPDLAAALGRLARTLAGEKNRRA
ncbi:MAG: hypothetical protein ACPGUC_07315 [Gammaproteobacteria bacterium]